MTGEISVDRKWFETREDNRNTKSHETLHNEKHSEIDEVPDKIDFHGNIGRLIRQMALNACGIQSGSEMTNETEIAPSYEEEVSHNQCQT